MESVHLYPMLFEPNLHQVVWGGDRLVQWKNLEKGPNGTVPNGSFSHIGESWEVSAVESSPCVVSNGAFAGKFLPEVVASAPEGILGKAVARRYGNKMPLLVKFIDAQKDLSIQVHPDDEMAQHEHGKNGKTEMWYILDAEQGACIYSGFKKSLTADEYKRMVQDGTIVEALACHEVHAGDVFYIPAGRVHAICGGIMLAEIQQSSDVTYRIFDYNRPGLDGKPRQLHTELAAKALNYNVESRYRTAYSLKSNHANRVVETAFFSARVTDIVQRFHRDLKKYDSFIITMCLKGDCRIMIRETGDEIVLKEGFSCLIPAAIANYDIEPLNCSTKVLDAFIDNQKRGLIRRWLWQTFRKTKR